MAYSSSFKPNSYIIVEHSKIDNVSKFLQYLEYLSEFCKIKKVVNTENEVHIYPHDECNRNELIFLGMCVRFAYEGRPGTADKTDDIFYPIYDHFMILVELFPKLDKAVLLIFAHNIMLKGRDANSNHCFVYSSPYSNGNGKLPVLRTTEYIKQNLVNCNGISYNKESLFREWQEMPQKQSLQKREKWCKKEDYIESLKEMMALSGINEIVD